MNNVYYYILGDAQQIIELDHLYIAQLVLQIFVPTKFCDTEKALGL